MVPWEPRNYSMEESMGAKEELTKKKHSRVVESSGRETRAVSWTLWSTSYEFGRLGKDYVFFLCLQVSVKQGFHVSPIEK